MRASVEFGILGPVDIRVGDRVIGAGHPRQCAVLAVLLLDLGRVVSPDLLIDRVWGEEPPASVRNVLHGYVARLRKVIAAAPDVELTRSPGGYVLRAQAGQLDLCRFRALAADAAKAGDDEPAAARLREALALWRGPALAGLDSAWLRAMRVSLEGERAAAALHLNEVRLRLGEHAALVSELSARAATFPADERLIGQLMLALYRCGRQAEALGWFEQARQRLAEEVGADPRPELRSLHERILRADPLLNVPRPDDSGPERTQLAPVPRELPPDVSGFSGRAAELTRLDQLIGGGSPGTVVISAVSGTAGVGKTTLALRWAHRIAHRFPDGQLHIDLRGFAPSGAPATPAEAIRGFLGGLGVPPDRVPPDPDAQARMYRSLLADKRMLIVLDNARDEAQVRPLLPASPASLILVTSRNQLTGLAAAHGARLLSLDVLPHGEAVQLLTARIGADRAGAEPGAVDEIAVLCAHLPLALAVTAARAVARPSFPLTGLAAELRAVCGRLDVLDTGDPAANVAAVFSWSYRLLSTGAARMFRLLGLHPGPDISAPAAASLAAVDEPTARRLLRELARHCLIAEHAPGRYAFHDLLRAYAAGKAREIDCLPARDAAIGRVLDHYLHTAARGALMLRPTREPAALAPPAPGACPERPADHRQALAWFEAEHQVLLAAVTLAAGTGADSRAWQLSCAMTPYLFRRGYLPEQVTIMGTALASATRVDDPAGQAMCLRGLGTACIHTGDYDQARTHLERCLQLYQLLGDRMGEGWAQQSLSVLAGTQGRYADGLHHGEQALRLYQGIGHEAVEAQVLNNLGYCHALLGSFDQARALCEQSLALIAKVGGVHFEYNVRDTLGYIDLHLGDFARAAAHFESALGLCRDHGNPSTEAAILTHLGDARHAAGEPALAREALQQALAIYDDLQHPHSGGVRAKLASMAD